MTTVPEDGATDFNLTGRLQRRDPKALAELYDHYGHRLYSRLLHCTGSRSAADDLSVETFVRAWNRAASLVPESSLAPWLLGIAKESAPDCSDEGSAAAASPKLRRRILAAAGHERFGWAPFLGGAAVLALSAAIYFGGRERTFATEVLNLRGQMRQQDVTLTRLNGAIDILSADGATESTFASRQVKGKVFVSPKQGILLVASNLTPAPRGQVYEMWLVSKSGASTPAGLFATRPDGTVLHVDREPVDIAAASSVAVTLEREGGAAQPGSPPVLIVPLH